MSAHVPSLNQLYNNKRFLIAPFPFFLLEFLRFIHNNFPIVVERYLETLQRSRRRPFKVNASFIKSTAVAGAFEFIVALQPVRRAPQMGAYRRKRVDLFRVAHDPYAVGILKTLRDLADFIVVRKSGAKRLPRLEQDIGEQESQSKTAVPGNNGRESGPADGRPFNKGTPVKRVLLYR